MKNEVNARISLGLIIIDTVELLKVLPVSLKDLLDSDSRTDTTVLLL